MKNIRIDPKYDKFIISCVLLLSSLALFVPLNKYDKGYHQKREMFGQVLAKKANNILKVKFETGQLKQVAVSAQQYAFVQKDAEMLFNVSDKDLNTPYKYAFLYILSITMLISSVLALLITSIQLMIAKRWKNAINLVL